MMMHYFSEIPQFPPSNTTTTTMINNNNKPWSSFSTLSKSPILNTISGDQSNCMEQLLIHCAEAIENNDATPVQQILWVLNNISPPDGDSNNRLTRAFLRALILRAVRTPACKLICDNLSNINTCFDFTTIAKSYSQTHLGSANIERISCAGRSAENLSLLDLANFVHLTPWYRFGFTAANAMILDALENNLSNNHENLVVHIVDISITHCMQIPTLIDSISTRFQGRHVMPVVKLTVGVITDQISPMFDLLSYDDIGVRLINFSRSKGVVLEFKTVLTTPSNGFASLIDQVRATQHHEIVYSNEIIQEKLLIVNCQMTLHYLQHEENNNIMSLRTMFLKALRSLEPDMVVIVEEDVDFTSRSLVKRLKSAYDYFWIPFDTLDTFLPKGNKQRDWYEADICWKIENVVANEGIERVERQEKREQWVMRLTEAGFRVAGFGEEAVAEVKGMLEEHAAGWGSKKVEEDIVLTWKGHNVGFACGWVPS